MIVTAPPGQPLLIDEAAQQVDDMVCVAREVVASLRDVVGAGLGSGLAVDAIGAAAARLSERVEIVARAYSGVAFALRDYATDLRWAHARGGDAALAHLDQAADRAISRILAAGQDLSGWAAQATVPLVSTALAPAGRLRTATGLALASSPFAALVIAKRLASDVLAPTPDVSRWIDDGTRGQAQARRELDDLVPGSATAIVEGMVLVDRAGGSSKAVVDIAHFAGPDGEERWLVTLPSTQDWVVPLGDKPAPNDLDANLAMMMLGPEVRTQYERAVVVAMEQAGVKPGDAVMFAGFSQGGIVAARLATTLHGEYAVGGVLAVGSPIDTIPIPKGVPVIAVQHIFDPVHRFDLVGEGVHSDARVTLWDGPGVDGLGAALNLSPSEAHNALNYAATTAHHDRDGSLTTMVGDFVLTDERVAAGWSVERRQFQFAE